MVEAGALLEEAVWFHLPGLVVVVGVGVLLCAILLAACCADSSPPPSKAADRGPEKVVVKKAVTGAGRTEEVRRPVPKPRPSPRPGSDSHENRPTGGYLNVPIPVETGAPSAHVHAYLNINAAGTKFQPVKFNVDKVIGTLKKTLTPYTVDSKRLELHEVIGKGAFGLVYKGTYKDDKNNLVPVAVKTVHGDECSPADMKSFLEEVVRMFGFNHVNVQSTTGICFRSSQPYAVMPFMECGDLRTFIVSPEQTLTMRNLIEFALQICKGMEYLSGCKFVHRDLAARNCMINNHHVIKVADFGLSRDIFTSDYYRMKDDNPTPLPIRWMALESLEKRVFTTKSDVWAFGIVLWELLTRGLAPYPNLPSLGVIDFVKGGGRLDKPPGCPSTLFNIMYACWAIKPEKRPSFSILVGQIHTILGGETGHRST